MPRDPTGILTTTHETSQAQGSDPQKLYAITDISLLFYLGCKVFLFCFVCFLFVFFFLIFIFFGHSVQWRDVGS